MDGKYEAYLKTTVKQAGLTFSTRVIGYLLGFINQAIYARLLGADLYGVYSIGFTVMNIAALFSVFGLTSAAVRFIGAYHDQEDKVRSIIQFNLLVVFVLSVCTSFLLIVFKKIIAVDLFHDSRIESILPYFAIGVILLSETNLMGGIFQGLKRPSIFFVYKEIVGRILRVSLFLLLYFLGTKLFGIVIATLISTAATLGGMFISLLKIKPDVLSKLKMRNLNKREILSYSSNMVFVSFTYFLMGQVNRLILGIYLDSTSVGIYTLSDTIAMLSVFILSSFNSIFASIIADLYHNKQYETLKNMYSNITRWIVLLTAPITLWMIIFSKEILSIFGREYAAGNLVLIFLTLGQFVNAFVGSNGLMLSMSGHQKFEMINGVVVALSNILLNIFLVPKLGIVGSAIAGSIAIAAVNIIKSVEVYFVLKMNPYNRRYLKALIASVVTCFSLLLLKNLFEPSVFLTVIGLVISFCVMFATIAVLKLYPEDKMILDTVIKRVKNR